MISLSTKRGGRSLDEIYTFVVRGPDSRLPRGYVWLIPVWFAILGGLIALGIRHLTNPIPLWLLGSEIGSMVIAALVLIGVLLTVRRHALRVNAAGVWIGISTTRRRPKLRQVHIPWADISQVRMVSRRYGVLLEISLGPAARIVARPNFGKQVLLLLAMLVMPFGFGRGQPALTAARCDPPRYLIKVCDVQPAQLRHVLTGVKPPNVPVRIATKAAALRHPPLPLQRPRPRPSERLSSRDQRLRSRASL
jgi:hypothetical protein